MQKGKNSDDGAEELGMANVGGVFFVLLVGSSMAVCFGCCEWFFLVIRRSKRYKVKKQHTKVKYKYIYIYIYIQKKKHKTKFDNNNYDGKT